MRVMTWVRPERPAEGWERFRGERRLVVLPAWVQEARAALPGAAVGALVDSEGVMTVSGRINTALDCVQMGASLLVVGLSRHLVILQDGEALAREVREIAEWLDVVMEAVSVFVSADWNALPAEVRAGVQRCAGNRSVGVWLSDTQAPLPPAGVLWARECRL